MSDAKCYRIPWLDYEEYGPRIDRSLLAVLWFETPLAILSLLLWAWYRPRIWLGNGLLSCALGLIPQKILGGRLVGSYNAYMGEDRPGRIGLARLAARHASLLLVNSQGSYDDARSFADPVKIRILPLMADDVFFSDGDPARLRKELSIDDRFVVGFVGRLDSEKHCDFLLKVAEASEPSKTAFASVGRRRRAADAENTRARTIHSGRARRSKASSFGFRWGLPYPRTASLDGPRIGLAVFLPGRWRRARRTISPGDNRLGVKIVILVGTRPELVQAEPLLRTTARQHTALFIHTGQHYDRSMSELIRRSVGLRKPRYVLGVGSASHAEQTARVMERLGPVLEKERPDCVLVFGDTNSTLAGALTASKLGIPLAHVEAGLWASQPALPAGAHTLRRPPPSRPPFSAQPKTPPP